MDTNSPNDFVMSVNGLLCDALQKVKPYEHVAQDIQSLKVDLVKNLKFPTAADFSRLVNNLLSEFRQSFSAEIKNIIKEANEDIVKKIVRKEAEASVLAYFQQKPAAYSRSAQCSCITMDISTQTDDSIGLVVRDFSTSTELVETVETGTSCEETSCKLQDPTEPVVQTAVLTAKQDQAAPVTTTSPRVNRFVLQGLPVEVSLPKITKELDKNYGIAVKDLYRLKNRRTGYTMKPVFVVTKEAQDVPKIENICNHAVRTESYKQRKPPRMENSHKELNTKMLGQILRLLGSSDHFMDRPRPRFDPPPRRW